MICNLHPSRHSVYRSANFFTLRDVGTNVLSHRSGKARGGSNLPGMSAWNQSPPRQTTFFGQGIVRGTSSIDAVVSIGEVVMIAWPIKGSVALATPVLVG